MTCLFLMSIMGAEPKNAELQSCTRSKFCSKEFANASAMSCREHTPSWSIATVSGHMLTQLFRAGACQRHSYARAGWCNPHWLEAHTVTFAALPTSCSS